MLLTPILLAAICTAGPVLSPTANTSLPLELVPVVTVQNLHYATLFAQDEQREMTGQAPAFAVPTTTSITPATKGIWESLGNDKLRWTLRVSCKNAVSMNLGFGRYNMPSSGSLTMYDASGDFRVRPFTADDNKAHGQLWTPVIPGNEAVIEIIVDNDQKAFVVKGIELTSINSGYRWVRDASSRGSSESCNVDVVCPEGNAWQNEIPSVAVYTLNGYLTCSGVMMNNTAQNQTPFFLTANHCGVTSSSDSTIVVYWNHENSYCRVPGSADSGGNGDGNFNQFTSGSTMRATRAYSDFTLTELSSAPNAAWGITFSGWSRSSSTTIGSGIHHPEAAEKRISFPDTVQPSGEYWDVNWGLGRTAPGSSGSPLYDSNHRVIGQLCCGSSYCPNDLNDYYGRSLNLSWSGGASSSLGSWLDPAGSNAQTLDTLVPGGGGDPSGACCVGTSCTYGTAAACSTIGGTYQGDFVSCTSYPCGGAPTGACCVAENCTVETQSACGTAGGSYLGDGSACSAGACDNGGCQVGYSPDCAGTCFEDAVYTDWIGDGYCDDGAYIPADYGYGGPAGVAIFLNCTQFNCDNDDCTGCDGGGDPTGTCCVGSSCTEVTLVACTASGGEWGGANTLCADDTCGMTTSCPADLNGDGAVNVSDVLAMVGVWGTNDPVADVDGDGTVGVSDLLLIIEAWGPCPAGDPTGACCVGTNCFIETQANCTALGGTYNGNGSACSANTCAPTATGACCVGTTCSIVTQVSCLASGGTYNGDNSSCASNPCGGGGCPAGEIEDCNGNCCPDTWVADGYCDDGTYEWNGIAIFLNCDQFACDGGDCTDCGGGEGCPAGWTADCVGTCFPDYVYTGWVGDGYCDDGAYIPADFGCTECPAGEPIWLNCADFSCDGGDCTCP
ncbi:MAG: hypothetical protein HOI88_08695 [Phycisphaerae bacterium]|jgi:lysyl endopeptidase|nr:hypothetical protein [Phycisphaerae bacterium]MBT5365756.1 hypothetical protein [Phycisphaerae bacterium]MBT6270406.1 hypothetical protein [Phycisphaerae bacterium]MBT6282768.1 hypothetical protein [Phycisphaerae bacterium]